jgi:hypothetical protein
VNAPRLTRRRALALGAAAGLSSLLSRALPDAVAAVPGRPGRSFGLDLAPSAFGADGRTAVLTAPRAFDLLGARTGAVVEHLEVRVRTRAGHWSPWVPLGSGGAHRPDAHTGEHASDPIWAGDARELQLRAPTRPAAPLRLHLLALSAAERRRGARAAQVAHAAQAVTGPPPIIPRAAWGGDQVVPRAAPDVGDVQMAFVHHTVSANTYTPADSPSIVLGIALYHRDTNRWNDIGYNFLVDRFGQIFEGRAGGIDQAIVGAQAQGWNRHSTGIANLGTFEAEAETPEAIEAMAQLIAWKLPLHGAPVTGPVVVVSGGGTENRYADGVPVTFQRISGHRDGCKTECPGSALYGQLDALRARTAAIAPVVVAPVVGLAMDPAPASLPYGQPLTLRGTLRRADGTPVTGQPVLVQKQGTSRWVTVATVVTDAEGVWTATLPWRRSGAMRAQASVPGTATVVSPEAAIACLPILQAGARTTRVRAGRTLTIDGTVRPAAPVTVTVEKQGSDGRYRRVATVTVKPRTAAFRARVTLRRPGLYRLTPRTGSGSAKAAAAALYVRAVRPGASLTPPSPGAAVAGA